MNSTLLSALVKASLLIGQPWLDFSGIELRAHVGTFQCGSEPAAWGCFQTETHNSSDGRQRQIGIMTLDVTGPYRAALAHESLHAVRWLAGEPDWDRHDALTARASRGPRLRP